jgi:hypothetical protein
VHFNPGGAYPFLKLPFGELHNRHVGLDSFWGRATASRVREQLLVARTPKAKAGGLGGSFAGRRRRRAGKASRRGVCAE